MTMMTNVRSQGAIARAGGQTTEATTTTAVANTTLLTAASMSVVAGVPVLIVYRTRKSAGAAAAPTLGVTLNAVNVLSTGLASGGMKFGATDEAQSGLTFLVLEVGDTNYTRGLTGAGGSSGATDNNFGVLAPGAVLTNALPAATLTDVIIVANAVDAAITVGADELHVYKLAVAN